MSFFHGVETVEVQSKTGTILVIKSGVIFLIGLAPIGGSKSTVVMVQNEDDAAQFGEEVYGFTIPQALAAIYKQAGRNKPTVLVCNVYESADHGTQIDAEAHAISNRQISLTNKAADVATLVVKNSGATVTYVLGTDYTVDAFGTITIINNALAEGTSLKCYYMYVDRANVESADIIGSINTGTDVYTGLKLINKCMALFGFSPKLIIAPYFCEVAAIATDMLTYTTPKRSHALIDAPVGTTKAVAIAGRGPAGAINFYTSNKRALLCFPQVYAYDKQRDTQRLEGISSYLAGKIAANDSDDAIGYWSSASNMEIAGILGLETDITWAINDSSSDANALNAVGIITVAAGFGTGFRFWGNRNASFPGTAGITSFYSVQRTADVIDESAELGAAEFIDKNINQAQIDAVVETVNGFLRTLAGRGAILDGEAKYDPTHNSAPELAAGHVVFDYDFCPPPPMERMTFKRQINIDYLSKIS